MREKVEALIADVIRPLIAADGGDIELVGIEPKRVLLRLSGAYVGCPGTPAVIASVIEPVLRTELDPSIEIKVDRFDPTVLRPYTRAT